MIPTECQDHGHLAEATPGFPPSLVKSDTFDLFTLFCFIFEQTGSLSSFFLFSFHRLFIDLEENIVSAGKDEENEPVAGWRARLL